MRYPLFTEKRTVYETTAQNPHTFRVTIKMKDMVDHEVLRHAASLTMKRYPYFAMQIEQTDDDIFFADNDRPMPVIHGDGPITLGSDEVNGHLLNISWWKNKIHIDVYHALTDGGGIYPLIKTLLYYYCSAHYLVTLPKEGFRLVGDVIPAEEWTDPLRTVKKTVSPLRPDVEPALDLLKGGPIKADNRSWVYSLVIPEAEFLRFSKDLDGSPGTIVALFLSRAIAALFPNRAEPVKIALFVNWRKALHTPLAHQCLTGPVPLEYHRRMRSWPLEKQAVAYRGMTFAQSWEENVLSNAAAEKERIEQILSKPTEQKRRDWFNTVSSASGGRYTAAVSYVGKANFGEAEKYIRDFRTWVCATSSPCLAEASAVNGRFVIDISQVFSDRILVDTLLEAFREQGIGCELQDSTEIQIPNVRLPWST